MLEKILLGVSLAAPIGPVSVEMIRRGLQKGFFGAFVVRLGGSVGNSLCLIAAYFGLGLLLQSHKGIIPFFSLAGAFVLMYMGVKSLLDKRKHQFTVEQDAKLNILNGLATGFVLSIANPIGLLFWVTIFAATLDHSAGHSTAGLLENFAIILGVLIWGAFLSGLLEVGKRLFNQKFINIITILAGLMLIGFGLKYAYKAILLIT